MREILFRGKRKYNGEWVYGGYFHETLYYGDEVDRHWIIIYGEFDYDNYETYEVIPESVGEYTGLTDKNGTPIYEGDVIAGALRWAEKKKSGVVTFKDGSFGLIWYRGEAKQFNAFTSMCNVEYEVIDNIHDNPELLKGGKADA